MKPYLIAELGLHGEGRLDYYIGIVSQIAESWTGWPHIMIKTQSWLETDSPWTLEVQKRHGRAPLASLTAADHGRLKQWCNGMGFPYAVTMHDVQSCQAVDCDYVKLGAFDNLQGDIRAAAAKLGKPVIASGSPFSDLIPERVLSVVSKYPANIGYSGSSGGYSCHSVPQLAWTQVLAAAPHCHTIEVHVTDRPVTARPQPGDLCVSMRTQQFINLSKEIGQIWRAE